MVNTEENPKHEDHSAGSAKWFQPETGWTLLFIGNRGKPITLKRFKGMVLLTLLVVCVLIVLAAGLLLWNRNILREKNQLAVHLNNIEEQNRELRHERDVLLTRLVLSKSRLPDKQSNSEKQTVEESSEQNANQLAQSAPPTMKPTKTEIQKQVNLQPDNDPPGLGLSVTIENFKFFLKSGSNRLRVQFKLKNTSPYSQHVSGHAVVVLKGDEIQQHQWVSIPKISLVEGKPTGKQHGHAFGISNYKIMRFTANKAHSPDKFQTASVYVFTKTGELLLEQDFPATLTQ